MEEIIYLEPDEEITSVIDKIKNSTSNKLALVVPREATILQSVVNLKLLLREANNLQKEISLVTADKIGRNLAAQLGLQVFDSIKERRPVFQPQAPRDYQDEVIEIDMSSAKKDEIESPKGISVHHFQESTPSFKTSKPNSIKASWSEKKGPRINIDWIKAKKIVWPMLIVLIILVFIAGFITLPITIVKLSLKSEDFTKSEEITIAGAKSENIDAKIFTGTLIDISKEKEESFTATGKKNLGGKASGTLTLYNYWDSSSQNISKGSKFSSSSKTFLSKGSVIIPGTSIKDGNIVPGTVTIDIEAENPGEEYNVKSGRFTIIGISSSQQEKIYGSSSKDLTGGFSKEVTVISQEDYDKAKDGLVKSLEDQLNSEFKEKSANNEVLESAVQNETIKVDSSSKVDSEANDFTLKVTQRLRAIVYNKANFNDFVVKTFEKQLPYDKMITLGPNGSINASNVQPKYNENILVTTVEIKAKESARLDIEKIKSEISGKKDQEVKDYLTNLGSLDGFDIQYIPNFWLKKIPNFKKSLTVKIQYSSLSSPEINPSQALSPEPTPSL